MARIDLGLPEDEIGELTLKEFDALLERKRAEDNRVRYNAGIIAAMIANAAPFADPNRRAMSPRDFVPDLAREDQIEEQQQREIEDLNLKMARMKPDEIAMHMYKTFVKGS